MEYATKGLVHKLLALFEDAKTNTLVDLLGSFGGKFLIEG